MSQIITIDDLDGYMDKSLSAVVAQQVVDAVNQFVETKTNRSWGETKTVIEQYDWKRVIYLRHQDIVAVTQIRTGYPGQIQTVMNATSYFVNKLGRLTFFAWGMNGFGGGSSPLYSDWLEITYQYGVADAPDDLKLASLGVAAGFYNWATNGNKDIVASQVGSYRVEFSGAVRSSLPNPSMSTAEANWAVIDSYRTRHI